MQIDIKTTAVEQVRQTFSHVARRLGADKPASRYQEATLELQPEVNFHYKPLWEPDRDLYDKRRTAIEMNDWYAFKDPRQYYYGTYTVTRARQQDAMEKSIEFVTKRALLSSLDEPARARIASLIVPLRHVEWAANTNNCFVTAYGWGTAITQATMFHAMDRLGIAQYQSRIGLLLDGNSGNALLEGKRLWLEAPAWQPLRRTVENLMVVRDWFETFVAQNLVLDGLLYPLVHSHIDARLAQAHGPGLSMLNEFAATWFDESSRWVDATVKTAFIESPQNAALITRWVQHWHTQAVDALTPFAEAALGEDADHAMQAVNQTFEARIKKLGISLAASEPRNDPLASDSNTPNPEVAHG